LTVHGPKGDFVLNAESARPLIFIAIDTGFGAIKSLIEHAMALDVAESMHLYRGTSSPDGVYQDNLCRAWSDALDEFSYTALQIASGDEGLDALIDRIAEDYSSLAQYDIYLCAHKEQLQPVGIALENRTGAFDQRVSIEPIRIS
jgi:CDP-4-dehydro-6-deoxyglucose reductase